MALTLVLSSLLFTATVLEGLFEEYHSSSYKTLTVQNIQYNKTTTLRTYIRLSSCTQTSPDHPWRMKIHEWIYTNNTHRPKPNNTKGNHILHRTQATHKEPDPPLTHPSVHSSVQLCFQDSSRHSHMKHLVCLLFAVINWCNSYCCMCWTFCEVLPIM